MPKKYRLNAKKIAKGLGADYHISVKELSQKLHNILDDKKLPQSVRDAARKELSRLDSKPLP